MNTGNIKYTNASSQGLLPGKYSLAVRVLCFTAFLYVIAGFLNNSVFHLIAADSIAGKIFLSGWTEYLIILIFGIWRTLSEKDSYTKKRLLFLTASVTVFWWLIPEFLKITEYSIGNLPHKAVFPSLHLPGTLTFFLTLIAVYLFGRRVICGWFCPCVGIRELTGFPFRANTPKSSKAFKWRHLKWFYFTLYMIASFLIFTNSPHSTKFYSMFMMIVVLPYFSSFLLSPILGNRSYCRFICPYAATFGILNKIGFFKLKLDKSRCTECRLCEKACDMGISVMDEGQEHGEIKSIDECMGCGRCISVCSKNALQFRDIRNSKQETAVKE